MIALALVLALQERTVAYARSRGVRGLTADVLLRRGTVQVQLLETDLGPLRLAPDNPFLSAAERCSHPASLMVLEHRRYPETSPQDPGS